MAGCLALTDRWLPRARDVLDPTVVGVRRARWPVLRQQASRLPSRRTSGATSTPSCGGWWRRQVFRCW